MGAPEVPELGVLNLAVVPEQPCVFGDSPARSIRAALLRRLEFFDPDLSQDLHDRPNGASFVARPWTISPLLGPLTERGPSLIVSPGEIYWVRITGLAPRVVETLDAAFLSDHPLAREPLELERTPFAVDAEKTHWEGLSSYSALLAGATPQRHIALEFRSPTAFRRGQERSGGSPEPRTCMEGYLRKWNALSNIAMPEGAIREIIDGQLKTVGNNLKQELMRLGGYTIDGVIGTVEWFVEDASPYLLRLVNALVDYAAYCGTGIQTTQGMGQTVRLDPNARSPAGES